MSATKTFSKYAVKYFGGNLNGQYAKPLTEELFDLSEYNGYKIHLLQKFVSHKHKIVYATLVDGTQESINDAIDYFSGMPIDNIQK